MWVPYRVDFIDVLKDLRRILFDQLSDIVVELSSSPLVYVVLLLICFLDGFFPPVPSESVLVSVAAIAATTGRPLLGGVFIAAAVGAVFGDSVAYFVGRCIGLDRLAHARWRALSSAYSFAAGQMERHAATLILIGRYIPVGRMAVNMTAGATRLRYRRFLLLSGIAAAAWSVTSLGIAVAASTIVPNPVAASVLAVIIAAGLGLGIDRVVRRTGRRRAPDKVGRRQRLRLARPRGSDTTAK